MYLGYPGLRLLEVVDLEDLFPVRIFYLLFRDPRNIHRAQNSVAMPDLHETYIAIGDELLFCGTRHSQGLLDATLHNAYTLAYLMDGVEHPRGYLIKWVHRWSNQRKSEIPHG